MLYWGPYHDKSQAVPTTGFKEAVRVQAQSGAKGPRRHVYSGDPLTEPVPPELAPILERHRGKPDALITALEEIQLRYGYLPERPLRYAARELRLSLSRVFGVATFYNHFQLSPPSRYTIQVCRGTACHVSGSARLLTSLETALGIKQDESTPDGLFSLRSVACLGCCSLAPVVVIGQDIHSKVSSEGVAAILERYRDQVEEVGT